MRISDWSSDVCSSDLWIEGKITAPKSAMNRLQRFLGLSGSPRLISDSGARLVYGRSATTTPATPAMSDSRYESEWARQRHRVEYSVIQCGMPSASAGRDRKRVGKGKSGSVRVDLGGSR